MVISEITGNAQSTKDNIGARDSTRDIILDRNNEKMLIEENATTIKTNTIGHSFIAGHSVNGVSGVANAVDGHQIVAGEAHRTLTTVRVINPNNNHREHFRDTTFRDSPTTADWNTTLFRLAMTTATSHATVYNTVATSSSIFLNNETLIQVVFNATETKFGNDTIRYFLSSDGGSNWEEITLGVLHTFTIQGTDLRYKVVFAGNGANETYIEDIVISYTV